MPKKVVKLCQSANDGYKFISQILLWLASIGRIKLRNCVFSLLLLIVKTEKLGGLAHVSA